MNGAGLGIVVLNIAARAGEPHRQNDQNATNCKSLTLSLVILHTKMHLMFYLGADGKRIYTLKVRFGTRTTLFTQSDEPLNFRKLPLMEQKRSLHIRVRRCGFRRSLVPPSCFERSALFS